MVEAGKHEEHQHILGMWNAYYYTLNIVLSITSYLELRYAITIYCISQLLPTTVKLDNWTL